MLWKKESNSVDVDIIIWMSSNSSNGKKGKVTEIKSASKKLK